MSETTHLHDANAKIALWIILLSAVFFAAVVPFAKVQWISLPPFIGAYEAALFFNSLLTSVYFFCQFARLQSRAVLILGMGFLYDALLVVPHALSFPNLMSGPGWLGGDPQTTGWLYLFWHGGFPLFPIAYTFLANRTQSLISARNISLTIMLSIMAIVTVVIAQTELVTTYVSYLPNVIGVPKVAPPPGVAIPWQVGSARYIVIAVWTIGIIAMVIQWLHLERSRQPLDLWLTVVMTCWVFDVALSSLLNHGRYDVGFYIGRVYGLMAAGFILVMMLIDTTRVNERLSIATAELKETNDTLELRVQERSAELARILEERHRLELQLAQSQKMQAIGNLTGGIAHDFNNLLSIIIGNLDILVETPHDQDTDELLRSVLTAAIRGTDMTKRLLAFARQQPLKHTTIDVNTLIDNLFKLLSRALGRSIGISLQFGDVWPVTIDSSQLEDAITNLTTNARDAMPKGGRIIITTENQHIEQDTPDVTAGDYVMISFSDSGQGIPAEVMAHIFEPFFSTKGSEQGTGLGLTMVMGFMKHSGGHVTVSSEIGKGTTFRLYLPRG